MTDLREIQKQKLYESFMVLQDQLDALEKESVYCDDIFSEEIAEIKVIMKKVERKVKSDSL